MPIGAPLAHGLRRAARGGGERPPGARFGSRSSSTPKWHSVWMPSGTPCTDTAGGVAKRSSKRRLEPLLAVAARAQAKWHSLRVPHAPGNETLDGTVKVMVHLDCQVCLLVARDSTHLSYEISDLFVGGETGLIELGHELAEAPRAPSAPRSRC